MQSLMGGTPMANAPSSLGISPGPSANPTPAMANGLKASNPPVYTSAEAAANAQGLVYPALHLHPLNDTFAPKQISLAPPGPNNRIKIGRQTNAKTVPNPTNGYFDSKVLSRMHAEVWSQNGKVYIKDVKSSNGTFINGERLSPEAQESDVFELHNEDMVEFGIDIVGDDNKTIIHHKVACRVYLVLTAEDALSLRHDFASLYRGGMHGGPLGTNGVGPGAEGGLRKTKAGFSFDHVLTKLQSELQRSKDTWNDLGSLTTTMHDIHETLGGSAPPLSSAPYPHLVPPPPGAVNAQQQQQQQQEQQRAKDAESQAAATEAHSATISALQAQLSETQSSLAAHVEKIRSLESILSEHDSIKREVSSIKIQMEQAKREMDAVTSSSGTWSSRQGVNGFGTIRGTTDASRSLDHDEFDDGASVASVETITQNNQNQDEDEDEDAGHVGPHAPPDMPAHLVSEDVAGMISSRAAEVSAASARSLSEASSESEKPAMYAREPASALTRRTLAKHNDERDVELRAQNEALSARLEELASQLEQALALSRGLQDQHAQVTDTVKTLEERVHTLEEEVEQKAAAAAASAEASEETSAALLNGIEGRWTEFRSDFEESWRKEREGMQSERDELRQVVRAWDEANRRMEDELNGDVIGDDVHGEESAAAGSSGLESSQDDTSSMSNAAGSSSLLSSNGSSNRGKRGNGRRKRHVNSALRSLLYGSSAAGLMLEADGRESEDDDRWGHPRVRLSRRSPDDDALSTSQSVRSIADSTSTRPSTSTEMTTPDLGPDAPRSDAALESLIHPKHESHLARSRHAVRDGGAENSSSRNEQERAVGPQTIAAAGIVLIGVTAWILAGKDLARLNMALSGKP
ncbi:uncharacterized protein MEPE_02686 [Melanopsichium pennsylvanicum]|uniref:FHA domain-containing protein n=2 Tax=Melanopsichium pennsylvanicum TaxID=63383 RepID=A0AAJ4XMZ3_9BASI|nr:cell cycle arrest in response to pheromone-related protein [Melanopsichium pennsylvanicum 4]SNX83978.1 uncharacterized protein MEPE_02686 [Melanopsichium pennsylvanicum]